MDGCNKARSRRMETDKLKETAKAKAEELSKRIDAATMGLFPKRIMATFVDLVIIGVLNVLVSMVAFMLLPRIVFVPFQALMLVACGFAILIKDGPFRLGPLNGQSIGKKALGIRVLTKAGQPISFQESVQRNLTLAAPSFVFAVTALISAIPFIGPLIGFFAAIASLLLGLAILGFELFNMYRDTENRRWGDVRAGTIVNYDE
jgi:uncharacterized RDD family membrane protein YckC